MHHKYKAALYNLLIFGEKDTLCALFRIALDAAALLDSFQSIPKNPINYLLNWWLETESPKGEYCVPRSGELHSPSNHCGGEVSRIQ